jgi:alpha-glucosidase
MKCDMIGSMSEPMPDYTQSIHHDGSERYIHFERNVPARLGDQVTIRLRTAPDVPIERIILRLCPDGEQQFLQLTPERDSDTPACRWWQVNLRLQMPVTHYRFVIFTRDGVWHYNAAGLQEHLPTDHYDFRLLADYAAPGWVRSSVFYQVFPDRFADGDLASNVRNGEFEYRGFQAVARKWGEPPTEGSRAAMVEFYGGDLQGIQARLDYLQELGVNALYLNPIFSAFSNHRYDVVDYENVDVHLGGNPALASLRAALNQAHMHYILDIVPNHCGVMHPWFQDAQADPAAPSAEFFTFHQHPEEYEAWLGVRSLPKLNYRSQRLRDVMYAAPEAVFRRWLRAPYTAEGWRIDVANMLARQGANQLGLEITRGIRKAVKEENPAAYLLGENFFDGSEQLQGDALDAVMNYSGFTKPLWWWLGRFNIWAHGQAEPLVSRQPWPTNALVRTWLNFMAAIPWEIATQQLNLLGSHDTARILSQLQGNINLARLAAGVLLTFPGVPCIYYGEEIGMAGSTSLQARACMIWDSAQWNQDLRSFYQTLIGLRRNAPALIKGGFQVLWTSPDSFAYLRDAESDQIIVLAHRASEDYPAFDLPVWQAGIPNGWTFKEIFSGNQSTVAGGRLGISYLTQGIQIWRSSKSMN